MEEIINECLALQLLCQGKTKYLWLAPSPSPLAAGSLSTLHRERQPKLSTCKQTRLQFLSALPQLQLLSGQDNELIDLLALTKRETRSKLVFVWANDGKWNDKSKRPFNNCPD
ncbi:hypothetical protein SAY86_012694 [Trapa natans]|uniref:Uncharacterized protein n=1 Tax=Trapa natans TaxID=22666 RepID=A0AAN7LXI2_TRANT|nr:hypothetical protein SAY86_012694 [Trapa natans]